MVAGLRIAKTIAGRWCHCAGRRRHHGARDGREVGLTGDGGRLHVLAVGAVRNRGIGHAVVAVAHVHLVLFGHSGRRVHPRVHVRVDPLEALLAVVVLLLVPAYSLTRSMTVGID